MRRFHESFGVLFVAAWLAASTSGCLDTGVRNYDDGGDRLPNATTLAEARLAVVKMKADSALRFYEELRAREPDHFEAIYMTTARKWDLHLPKPVLEMMPSPDEVLTFLSMGQIALRPMSDWVAESIRSDFDRYSPTLTFKPFSLGVGGPDHAIQETEVLFDISALWVTSVQAYGIGYGLQLAQAVDLSQGPNLNSALTALRTQVYSTPECRDPQREEAQIACAQRVMDQGLEMIHRDPRFQSFLTVTRKSMETLNPLLAQFQGAFSRLKLSAARPALPDSQNYLTNVPNSREMKEIGCFVEGVCPYEYEPAIESEDPNEAQPAKTIRVDLFAFLRTLEQHGGLRVFIPTKVKLFRRVSRNTAGFLAALEFADPKFGGLFPDGDLLSQARANPTTELAQQAVGLAEIMTAWAFPGAARRR